MFILKFDTDNAAFQDGRMASEIDNILWTIRDRVNDGHDMGVVIDSNGNKVGDWKITKR